MIAAEAVVTKNVEPFEIVGGNPAKHIRYRFNKEIRNKLLMIAWWNWDIEKIRSHLPAICNCDIQSFIDETDKK